MEGAVYAEGSAQLKRGDFGLPGVPSGFGRGSGRLPEHIGSEPRGPSMSWAGAIPEEPQAGSLCKEYAPDWLRDVLPSSQRHTLPGPALPGPDGNGIQFKSPDVTVTSNGLVDSARPDKWTDLLEPLSDSAPLSAMIGRCQKACPLVTCPVLDAGHAPILPF